VDGKRVGFAGGETGEVDAAVWATGYKDNSRWVAIPEAKDGRGGFAQRAGLSPVPGLYFIGRSWQWTRGSALLHGVGEDAAFVVSRIAERLSGKMSGEYDVERRGGADAAATESLGLKG
jgi:putative flavoprotein involved in K+ transport